MSLFTPHKDRLSGFESERRAAEDQRIGRHHFGGVRLSAIVSRKQGLNRVLFDSIVQNLSTLIVGIILGLVFIWKVGLVGLGMSYCFDRLSVAK